MTHINTDMNVSSLRSEFKVATDDTDEHGLFKLQSSKYNSIILKVIFSTQNIK
jgi:hypothetical protein